MPSRLAADRAVARVTLNLPAILHDPFGLFHESRLAGCAVFVIDDDGQAALTADFKTFFLGRLHGWRRGR